MNELLDLAEKSKKKTCLIVKVDFGKASGSVSCMFLDYVLIRFGFISSGESGFVILCFL